MSQAAVGYEGSEIMISSPDRAPSFRALLHSQRVWRNTALAVVAVAAAANVGLLVITAGF
jgi:hypothetical protein